MNTKVVFLLTPNIIILIMILKKLPKTYKLYDFFRTSKVWGSGKMKSVGGLAGRSTDGLFGNLG